MKKKRFLKIICCFCLLLCSTFFLAACGENPVGGYESGSDAPAPDNTPPSTGDDSDVDIDDDGNIKSGEVADFSQYFSGYMVTLNESGDLLVKDDTLGVNKKVLFTALVDRQIDILSQDILNGLNYIYGNYRLTTTNVWGNSIVLNCLVIDAEGKPTDENSPYQYGELTAMTHTDKLLTQLSKSDYDSIYGNNEENKITATLTEININVLSDYQKSLLLNKTQNNNISTENNYFADVTALNLMGASSGQNMRLNKAARLVEDTDKVWKVSQLTTEETKNNLKLMIAQILTNDAGSDYDALISKIDKLGFDSTFNDKLIDVVNENIIGSDRIAEDDKYYKELVDNYDGVINDETIGLMRNNTKLFDSDTGDKKYTTSNSPRLYKGYNKLVPVIVKSALDNKFYGTNISLYPTFSNIAHDYSADATGFKDAHDYSDVTLLAKANTLYTKLVVKIKGSDLSSSEASLEYQLEINGKPVGTKKEIKLSDTEKEFTLDISGYGTSFGEYKGNTEKDVNTKIFEKTTISDSTTETNYIKFNFTNSNGAKFTITFDGYYDKNAQ